MAEGDKDRGLYNKYTVNRNDHSPAHESCDYFVLDMTHDEYAKPAIRAYADACEKEYPMLAAQLRAEYLS